jgi:hypothetical protein
MIVGTRHTENSALSSETLSSFFFKLKEKETPKIRNHVSFTHPGNLSASGFHYYYLSPSYRAAHDSHDYSHPFRTLRRISTALRSSRMAKIK